MTGALEAVQGIIESGGEPDEVLRRVVGTLVESGATTWAGILFVESGELVLGPEAGTPTGEGQLRVPVVYAGKSIAELTTEGTRDRELLEAVAALLPEHCLVGWDTGGAPWEP